MSMKKIFSAAIGALVATGTLVVGLVSARAEDLKIESAWARASVGSNGAAFVTVFNGGAAPDRLVGVASPVAPDVMLHRSFEEGGMMKMEHVLAVPIDAGQRVEMKPGGMHIMLVNLKRPLKKGDQLPLSLRFERGGAKDVTATVYGPGAMEPK
jgi:periplasmic copper chaperone A